MDPSFKEIEADEKEWKGLPRGGKSLLILFSFTHSF